MTEDPTVRYARQIEDGKDYTNLYLNEDFQKFKREQFEEPMLKIIELVMDAPDLNDLNSIRENIIKYQTLRRAYVDSFNNKMDTAMKARELLNNQRRPKEVG